MEENGKSCKISLTFDLTVWPFTLRCFTIFVPFISNLFTEYNCYWPFLAKVWGDFFFEIGYWLLTSSALLIYLPFSFLPSFQMCLLLAILAWRNSWTLIADFQLFFLDLWPILFFFFFFWPSLPIFIDIWNFRQKLWMKGYYFQHLSIDLWPYSFTFDPYNEIYLFVFPCLPLLPNFSTIAHFVLKLCIQMYIFSKIAVTFDLLPLLLYQYICLLTFNPSTNLHYDWMIWIFRAKVMYKITCFTVTFSQKGPRNRIWHHKKILVSMETRGRAALLLLHWTQQTW